VLLRGEAHHQNCLPGSAHTTRACARLNKEIVGATHGPTDRHVVESHTIQVRVDAHNLIINPILHSLKSGARLPVEGGAVLGISLDPVVVSNKERYQETILMHNTISFRTVVSHINCPSAQLT
jgi:hypothetical protein